MTGGDAPVFLHYTQEELDRNYDQRGWVENAEEIIARYSRLSEATRTALGNIHREMRYGAGPDEMLDVFAPRDSGLPIFVFVHGGAWRNFSKADFSFVADALVELGIAVVVVNFSKLPAARLPVLIDQVARAIDWTAANAEGFGGDPTDMYVFGYSSGAHLVASALVTRVAAPGGKAFKGATLLSGSYDLMPAMLSRRGAYIELDEGEMERFSPARQAGTIATPLLVCYAEHDTGEFRRQSKQFKADLPVGLGDELELQGLNHFETILELRSAQSPLTQAVLSHWDAAKSCGM